MVSTPSSLTKRSRVRVPLGTESPLLGSALPPNVGLPGANPNLVGLQCGYRTPDEKPKKKKKKFTAPLQCIHLLWGLILPPPHPPHVLHITFNCFMEDSQTLQLGT